VAIDARGAVTASAVLGKPGALTGDTLAAPTVRYEYQLTDLPASARVFTRVAHGVDGFEEAIATSMALPHPGDHKRPSQVWHR
jgi:hypothetical protein